MLAFANKCFDSCYTDFVFDLDLQRCKQYTIGGNTQRKQGRRSYTTCSLSHNI